MLPMSAFFRLGAHATVYRPLPVGTALFLPLVVLVWLAVFPPHALDMAIARWFFSDGAFVAQSDPFFRCVLHQAMKRPAIMVAGAALLTALASRLIFREPSQKALSRVLFERSLYILIVLLLSLQIITTLKATTGVRRIGTGHGSCLRLDQSAGPMLAGRPRLERFCPVCSVFRFSRCAPAPGARPLCRGICSRMRVRRSAHDAGGALFVAQHRHVRD